MEDISSVAKQMKYMRDNNVAIDCSISSFGNVGF